MDEIYRYCQGILERLSCKIGCSDIYNRLEYLGTSMRQAYDRVMLSFYYPRQRYFYVQQVGKYEIVNGERYKILFSKALVNQNLSKAFQIKNDMMKAVQEEEVTDIDYIKKLYMFFITSIFHCTRDDVKKIEEQLADIKQSMIDADTLDKLNRIMEQEFEPYESERIQSGEYSSYVRNAMHYMKEHYAKALTLSEVAEQAGLSAEYLSRLFKEETGVKFVVYLNNLKLKHALRLLETTNLKVYEVAEQVGYSNLSYFSRVFKKNFGQNPFEYRNNFGNQDKETY